MNIISFLEVSPIDISVLCLSAMKYSPKLLKCSINNRSGSSLLHIVKGEYLYSFGDKSFTAFSGSTVYLPHGSTYEYRVVSENTECIQCTFDVKMCKDGETVAFSESPYIVATGDKAELRNATESLTAYNVNGTTAQRLRASATLLYLLSVIAESISESTFSSDKQKIKPAIDFMESNLGKGFTIPTLASLCYLSESQFRRTFKSVYGLSPIEYKNKLRIRLACEALKSEYTSISEISSSLGFDSIFNFSLCFKRIVGISPSVYAKNNKTTVLTQSE